MKKIVKYTVVAEHKMDSLIEKVNQLIQKGWEPQGGIATRIAGLQVSLFQAMIREEEESS
jgi:hypothetical protein